MAKSRTQKREEAQVRSEMWSSLSPKEKIAELNRRGLRAKRQRARIAKEIEDAKTV